MIKTKLGFIFYKYYVHLSNVYGTDEQHRKCGKCGKSYLFKEEYENKSIIHSPRQEVAFWGKAREIKGCGSLREDFYTRFIPKN